MNKIKKATRTKNTLTKTILGNNLAQARKTFGISQKEIAKLINCCPQTVARWEKGIHTMSASNAVALARVYGITLEKLVHG